MAIKKTRLTWTILPVLALAITGLPCQSDERTIPVPQRVDRSAAMRQTPTQPVQLDSHGRYPFGMYRGGYRYPFSYPYYRYGPRQYPMSTGTNGPYASNYGGYTGNRNSTGIYGSQPLADAPLPPPDAPHPLTDAPPPPPDAPPAQRPNQIAGIDPENDVGSQVHARPTPNAAQGYGDPVPYFGGNPFNPTYGSAQLYRAFPFGYHSLDMWFGHDRLIRGFGYYPNQNYSYFYGPPSGMGFYGPEYAPQYYNYSLRNFGPYYPGVGGINGGAGFYQGW